MRKSYILFLFLIFSQLSFAASVCNRTPEIVELIESLLKKHCADVSADDLSTIEEIRLENSNITRLKSGDLDGLINLGSFAVIDSPLYKVPDNLFFPTPKLYDVTFTKTQISTLPPGLLNGLSNLITFEISQSELTNLDENFFTGLLNLQHLQMDGNNLNTLPEQIFSGNRGLQGIVLSRNPIQVLPENLINSLPNLRSFDASDTYLSTLPEAFFQNSPVEIITLAGNKFTFLPDKLFLKTSNLKSLFIDKNRSLGKLPDLTTLKLLTNLEADADVLLNNRTQLQSVKQIYLHLYSLTILPEDFLSDFSSIESVGMEGGPVQAFPTDFFKKSAHLKEVDICRVISLTPLDNIFTGITTLKSLYLSRMGLTRLSPAFIKNLPNLETLWIQFNALTKVDDEVLLSMPRLKNLNFHSNNFPPQEKIRLMVTHPKINFGF